MVRQWLQATSNWQRAWPQAPPETTVMSESTPMIPPSPARSMSGVLTRTPVPCNNPCGMKRGEALARKASTTLPRFLKCPLQFDPMAMDHKQLSDADSTKLPPNSFPCWTSKQIRLRGSRSAPRHWTWSCESCRLAANFEKPCCNRISRGNGSRDR
jgi:hypothetical protein